MLDRLPIELLELILRFAAPLVYNYALCEERRETLRSCCLTSQRMRAVAQPMLPEVFAARKREEHVEALEAGGRGRQVKVLIYNGQYHREEEAGWLHRILAACRCVRDLRLFHAVLDLKWLEPLSEMRRVILWGGGIRLTDPATALPQLEELSMTDTASVPEDFRLLLRGHCLAALQSFSAQGLSCDEAAFSSALSSGFFNDLKLIVLSADDLARLPSSFPHPDPSRVLLTLDPVPPSSEFTPPFKPVHLSLCPRDIVEDLVDTPARLVAVRSFLPALSQHTICNLGVPDFLHPSRTLPSKLASLRRELLKACADNKIRVVWTARRTSWDSMVPPEFRAVLAEEAALRGGERRQKV
ncbi:hypothetical protein JCM10213_008305 [Rhodosporidiobolus nylandii]